MMKQKKGYLAVDLGASSGRVVAGLYDGSRLQIEEVHRFSTLPVEVAGSLRLDFDAFLAEICTGIAAAVDSSEILSKMGIPGRLFGDIAKPPSILGNVNEQLLPGGGGPVRLVAVGSHDTASAIAAAPIKDKTAAFISLGTWAIHGCEITEPVITDAGFAAGLQNNAVMGGAVALVRNRVGMWMLEECRRGWREGGLDYGFADLTELASASPPFTAVLKADAPEFFAAGEMQSRIVKHCEETGQVGPADVGETVRTILESLALSYRENLELLAVTTGRQFSCLHVVGGGSRNELLDQFIADACGISVIAGPYEATSAGSILAQLMADGEVASLEEGRNLISRSWPVKTYEPRDRSPWDEGYLRLQKL